ncbi:hypothetical protein KAR91_53535 [Candidatus Pacearchaeota archaeon]|nr:hypothetical protein [Candidatus Pacearchaeota archaeon]
MKKPTPMTREDAIEELQEELKEYYDMQQVSVAIYDDEISNVIFEEAGFTIQDKEKATK